MNDYDIEEAKRAVSDEESNESDENSTESDEYSNESGEDSSEDDDDNEDSGEKDNDRHLSLLGQRKKRLILLSKFEISF